MKYFTHIPFFKNIDKTLPSFAGLIFFWAIFDGILTYITPLVFSNAGLSNSELGLIIGSSSIFGAAFDLILSRWVRVPNYRRLYLGLFIICAAVPLILWQAQTIPFFILVMLLWGVYYDLANFSNLDFVSKLQEDKRTFYFSLIALLISVGYIVAPILAGIAVADEINSHIFILMWVMLAIAFIFFTTLTLVVRHSEEPITILEEKSIFREIKIWMKLGRIMWAPLLFTTLLSIYDAFFYTVGPLLAESFENIQPYNGLIMAAFSIPILLTVMFASKFTSRFGKKRTAYWGLLLGSIPLCVFPLTENPLILTVLIFISGIASSLCIPAINAVYTDFISEANEYEEDIEGVGDFMNNVGYVVGPIAAGFLADALGFFSTFAVLGVVLIIILAILIKFTPRHIDVTRIYRM